MELTREEMIYLDLTIDQLLRGALSAIDDQVQHSLTTQAQQRRTLRAIQDKIRLIQV